MAGYIRSTDANGVSAHFFHTPVTLSDAVRFNRAVSSVSTSDRAVCVSSASANVVFSVHTRCIAAEEEAPVPVPVTAPNVKKRGREDDEAAAAEPATASSRWIPRLFLRATVRRKRVTPPITPSTTAVNAINGAKRAAEDSEPSVTLDEEAWQAAEHCVAALDRLRSTDGVRVVQQLAVSVNQQRGDMRLFAQCPKIIVLARLAAGLATPLVDVLAAVPAAFRMDGLLSTSNPTSADPIGGALSARQTEEEATATNHGQPPLCVVIGLASAQPPEVAIYQRAAR